MSSPTFHNLLGKTFERLTVVARAQNRLNGNACWHCVCTCGNTTVVVGTSLRNGDTKSCGCLQDEKRRQRVTTYGQSKTAIYAVWLSMLSRCLNPRSNRYQWYGGRGITVCDRWRESFEAFLEDMGPRPSSKHTLDRIDNSLGYFKENCRWATRIEQIRNRRSTRLLTFNGTTLPMIEWAERLNPTLELSYKNIHQRLRKGWTVERALTTPLRPRQMVTYQGKTQSVYALAQQMHMDVNTLKHRLNTGWTVEEALTIPPGQPRCAS